MIIKRKEGREAGRKKTRKKGGREKKKERPDGTAREGGLRKEVKSDWLGSLSVQREACLLMR